MLLRMGMESGKKNPWPLRILIASMVCFVLGSIIVLGQMDTFSDALDPKKNNIESLNSGSETQKLVSIDEGGCYRAYGVGFEGNVTISELDGSDVKDPVEESKCKLDWNAMSTDGSVEYNILGSWELTEGDFLLRVECQGACNNETVWFTSIDKMESDLLGSPLVIVGATICCLGIFLLPLSGVLLAFSQNRKQNVMMVVGPDGQLMPLTDLTPSVVQDQINSMNQDAVDGIGFDVQTGEYMGSNEVQASQQMDGSTDVQAGSMLTTEQVYALMRGDVESATPQEPQQETVADPFPTPSVQPKPQVTQVLEKPKPTKDRKIPVAKNEDWQSWDED